MCIRDSFNMLDKDHSGTLSKAEFTKMVRLRWFSSRATFRRMLYNLSAERLIAEKKTPMLFMYGVEKRNKFHTEKIVELVRATPGCKVVPVANAGHWLYHESQQAELCFREVKAFVLGK